MRTKANDMDADLRDPELNEELAGVLSAISIVSRRLARKLVALRRPAEEAAEGGEDGVKDDEAR